MDALDGPEALVEHLKECRGIDAALVGGADVDMTPTVQMLLDAGWTYDGTEYMDGKRIRYLKAPAPEES